jgi:hypothetical protein
MSIGNPLTIPYTATNGTQTFGASSLIRGQGPKWGQGQASDVTLAEAIHVSSNAPVKYFDAPAQFPDRPGRYWDGAIAGCNNPLLAAVTEAVGKEQDATKVAVLCIGTAVVALHWPESGGSSSPHVQPNSWAGYRH